MNIVTITGRLARNAHLNGSGDKRAMKICIAANSGFDAMKKAERVEFVPCVYFNPTEKLQSFLSSKGKGCLVELQGNVVTSSFEKNGNRVWATEVRVNPSGFKLLPSGKGKENGDQSTEYDQGQFPPL